MQELRLVPAALVVWLVSAGWWWSMVLVLPMLWGRRWRGQVLLCLGLGLVAAAVRAIRLRRAAQVEAALASASAPGARWEATVERAGSGFAELRVPGYPFAVRLFSPPETLESGAQLGLSGGIEQGIARAEVVWIAQPDAGLRQQFRQLVAEVVGEASRGLIPGMVLGDSSAQSAAEYQRYIDTGLSHLSVVSGSNVAVVLSVAYLATSWASPRVRTAVSMLLLAVFVTVVGPEPAVFRAAVMGSVGVLAVLNSRRMEPIHGLCLAIIGLLLWRTELATSYGFLLSVAATAGIVVGYGLIYRCLAYTGWPDLLLRVIAVAIAADLATIVIIAIMSGQVSVVSVLANILCAPATTPVTIFGLIAVSALALGAPEIAVIFIRLCEPWTWWIYQVAHAAPLSTVAASWQYIVAGYSWVLLGFWYGRARVTVAAGVAVAALSYWLGLGWLN